MWKCNQIQHCSGKNIIDKLFHCQGGQRQGQIPAFDSADDQSEFTLDDEIEFGEAVRNCNQDVAKIARAEDRFLMSLHDNNRKKAARMSASASIDESSDYYSIFSRRRVANNNAAAKFTAICSLAFSSTFDA